MLKDGTRSVGLQIFVVCDKLDDTVPDLGANMISSGRDKLKDSVDIPFVLLISPDFLSRYGRSDRDSLR